MLPARSWKVNGYDPLLAKRCPVAFNQVIGLSNPVTIAITFPLVSDHDPGVYSTQAVGAAVSIVKAVTDNRLLGLSAASITLIRQLLCVPVESVLNIIVLLPEIAEPLALVQSQE